MKHYLHKINYKSGPRYRARFLFYQPELLVIFCLFFWPSHSYGKNIFNVFGNTAPQKIDEGYYTVRKVFDGDTIELANGAKVRYIGINAPETHKKTKSGWEEVKEPFGEKAHGFNKNLVEGRKVKIEFDREKPTSTEDNSVMYMPAVFL
jgi:endonuclease YncB( thermonuclease family)